MKLRGPKKLRVGKGGVSVRYSIDEHPDAVFRLGGLPFPGLNLSEDGTLTIEPWAPLPSVLPLEILVYIPTENREFGFLIEIMNEEASKAALQAELVRIDLKTAHLINQSLHPSGALEEQIGILRKQIKALLRSLGQQPIEEFALLDHIAEQAVARGKLEKEIAKERFEEEEGSEA